MGIRCDQWIGLTNVAHEWLREHVKLVEANHVFCPHCGGEVHHDTRMETVEEDRFVYGMFGDKLLFGTWRLKDGKLVREVLQADPWSSGPCFFTCLELEDGTRIGEWSDEEISRA